jgi:hypothetical protein
MRVRLRPGTTIDQAVMLLDRLAVNVSGEVHRPARTVEELRYSYVGWASSAERELLGVLARSDVSRIFENSRHRDICSSASSVGGHLRVLISDEVTAKSAELREIASELKAARDGMRRAPGCPTIIDTNVLLECNRPDQVKWASIVEHEQHEPVRLILPLRVIEEVDAKKYASTDRIQSAASKILRWLERLLSDSGCGPVPVGGPDDTTIEILLADRPRYRPSDADEEILDVCGEVQLLTGRAKLVTADLGMRLRARAESVDICVMPETYYRGSRGVAAAQPDVLPEDD